MTKWLQHPTGNKPKSVALVALGKTKDDFVNASIAHTDGLGFDEVWTLNTAVRILKHDVLFVMDDMSLMANVHGEHYAKAMREHDRPIITTIPFPEYPRAIQYPLQEVVNTVGASNIWFNHSVPYVLTYALMLGYVEKLTLFGADYINPATGKVTEQGMACATFWIGFCRARGMDIKVPKSSTLMESNTYDDITYPIRRFYGYVRPPIMEKANGHSERSARPQEDPRDNGSQGSQDQSVPSAELERRSDGLHSTRSSDERGQCGAGPEAAGRGVLESAGCDNGRSSGGSPLPLAVPAPVPGSAREQSWRNLEQRLGERTRKEAGQEEGEKADSRGGSSGPVGQHEEGGDRVHPGTQAGSEHPQETAPATP